ncbi:MAG: hypothetical protein ACRETC_06685 [Gammaproteobacteria bacterium]
MNQHDTEVSFENSEHCPDGCELSTATPTAALQARGGGAVDNSTLARRHVVVLTTREAQWVSAAISRYRGLWNALLAPEPDHAFLEELETRFFRLTPESDGS